MEVFILKFKAIAQYQIPELFKHCQPSPSDPGVMRQLLPPAHPMEMCYQWRGEFFFCTYAYVYLWDVGMCTYAYVYLWDVGMCTYA